jgi:aconitate hydratase 2/2-methylisocitrate dehydratase
VVGLAGKGNPAARELLRDWAQAGWLSRRPDLGRVQTRVVIRTRGEINTDFLSPAQQASSRDDIPLHALSILSNSPHDRDFLRRRERLLAGGLPLLFVSDVLGTGSSRKSASNSLVWWIGEDIAQVPNKRRGGMLLAGRIAPIFFNTVRGCGAVPLQCPTEDLREGQKVTVDLERGQVRSEQGEVLVEFALRPRSLLEEARAGGRNALIIGRKLTARAREACGELGIEVGEPAVTLERPVRHPESTHYTLAQKLVGAAAGLPGVLAGDYVEPRVHLVFSQDTTGEMTRQELMEHGVLHFVVPFIQSFCHTAAAPRSEDARMQADLGAFVASLGGIDQRPGDGSIHSNGNRFLLPYFVGTGGDSHTRFPIGLSFPAGSDLVALAAGQGFLPLEMPESVLVRFTGSMQPGITVRDLVNAIPHAALRQEKLDLGKVGEKKNLFSGRVLEMEGLERLTVEEAFKLTDASAERSAAAATFRHDLENVVEYVENNLRFLENNFSKRHSAAVVAGIMAAMREWLRAPYLLERDAEPRYAEVLPIDLDAVREPLLAAPNDPDRIVALSEVAGTPVEEVFLGSCMTDITDFRAAAAILEGGRVQHRLKFWAVPPDRETAAALGREGISADLLEAGANLHVPGCSLCMGNQGQFATGSTALSTSTRNFENRMGTGARVFLGSAELGAVTALLGELPDLDTYMSHYDRLAPRLEEMRRPLRHP